MKSSDSHFSILNSNNHAVTFDLKFNGKSFLSSENDAIAEIRGTAAYSKSDLAYATWNWLLDNSNNWHPYTGEHWINNAALYVNSLGFGYCDDVAGVFCRIMTAAGYDARLWGLDGHVVAEVLIDGRWELFDPDLETFYFTNTGDIAGYDYIVAADREELRANAAVFANKYDRLDVGFAYSDLIFDIYQSVDNNVSYRQQTTETIADAKINLPAGARMTMTSADDELLSMYGHKVPNLNRINISFGTVTAFDFDLPLILESVSGNGTILIGDVTYEIGSAELRARLEDRGQPIYDFAVSTKGAANSVSFLVNAERFSLDEMLAVEITAPLSITLVGEGRPYTLSGGGVGDYLTQRAFSLNQAAGAVLDGLNGDDTITFDGSQAYTAEYVTIDGGNGNDLIKLGLWSGQYIGSVKVKAGSGNDVIQIGHIEGSTNGQGFIDAGDGNDTIQFRGEWASYNAIWGNSTFKLLGNTGNDTFILTGTQVNVVGDETGVLLSGGSGFDTLHWNGLYNLTIQGQQNPSLELISGYRRELNIVDIERLDIASTGASGFEFLFTPADVAAITAGSDFDRSTLELGLTGIGRTLFIDPGSNTVDVSAFELLGAAIVQGREYQLYSSGADLLGILA